MTFKESLKQLFNKDNIKPFLFIFSIYVIAYSSIILADVYYIDDLRRSIDGNPGWENFSRYMSNYLSMGLNFSRRLTDIYPLGQLLAIVFLSLSSLTLSLLFNKRSYVLYTASTIIGLSPYFLENISYRYDSLYMSIAVFATIFPYLFIKNKRWFMPIGVLSLLLMWTTYQAANFIYVAAGVLVLLLGYLNSNKFNKSDAVAMAACMLLSLIIFKFFIYTEVDGYVNNQMVSGVSGIVDNLKLYFDILARDFKNTAVFMFSISLFVLLLINIFIVKRSALAVLVALIAFVFLTIFSYGLYLILQKPLFALRALNGIGGVICILVMFNLYLAESKILKFTSSVLSILFVANLAIISLSYGNALKSQQRYTNFRLELMLSDLNSISHKINQIVIRSNGINLSPVTQNTIDAFPILEQLIFQRLQQGWLWTSWANYAHYGLNAWGDSCEKSNSPLQTLDTALHKIEEYPNQCFEVWYK